MEKEKELTQYDLRIVKRRDFLRVFLLGGIFSLLCRKVGAEQRPEENLKKAMFWRRLDS
jgi:hypothetical protein